MNSSFEIFRAIAVVICFASASFGQLSALPFGKLDSSYGENGIALSHAVILIGNSTMLPDGKIATVATFPSFDGDDILVSRTLPSGQLDPSFGSAGIKLLSFSPIDQALDVASQKDGKLIVVGITGSDNFNRDFLIFRLNQNGEIDSSFGDNGSIIRDFAVPGSKEVSNDLASSVLVGPGNRILVGGTSNRYVQWNQRANSYITLVELDSNGSSNKNFGVNGVIQHWIGNDMPIPAYGTRSVIFDEQANGKILAGISVEQVSPNGPGGYQLHGIIHRYNSDGTIDTGFGQNGEVIPFPNSHAYCMDLKSDQNGKSYPLFSTSLARLNSDGTLDMTFGRSGYVSFDDWFPVGLALSTDGKVTITGLDILMGQWIGMIQRLNSDGTSYVRFGRSGTVSLRIPEVNVDFRRAFHVGDRHLIVTGNHGITTRPRFFTAKVVISK